MFVTAASKGSTQKGTGRASASASECVADTPKDNTWEKRHTKSFKYVCSSDHETPSPNQNQPVQEPMQDWIVPNETTGPGGCEL